MTSSPPVLPRTSCCTSPLVVTDRSDGGARAKSIDRGFARGALVRLARGVYCLTDVWLTAAPWDRHLLNAMAHSLGAHRTPIFSGPTALAVQDLPLTTTPSTLHLRALTRGAAGRRQRNSPYGNRQAAETLRRTLKQTHSVPHRLPDLPVVQGHWNLPSHSAHPPQPVDVTLSDGTFLGTVLADPPPVALAAVMRTGDLQLAVPPLNAYLRRHPQGGPEALQQLRETLLTQAQRLRFDAVLSFADARSESAGESLSRVVIHELGFELPTPQVDIHDSAGRHIARVDGLWRSTGLVGEFDGLQKYSGSFVGARASSEIVVAEKQREDALRRAGHDVARWVWADLREPARLHRILTQHGAPRRPVR